MTVIASPGRGRSSGSRSPTRASASPPTSSDKLFDRFFRASTAGDRWGTGLGLSIAKSIAEAHGGTISVAASRGGHDLHRRPPVRPTRAPTRDPSTEVTT